MVKINIYIKYYKYVCEHKKNVFKECMEMSKQYKGKDKRDLIIHAFTHDLSKFNPKEFIPYAKYFYGNYPSDAVLFNVSFIENKDKIETKEDVRKDFDKAWKHHYLKNKHHPEHWIGKDIPNKYIRQMICDLKAMSRKFGGTAQEYYLKNYYKWDITRDTRYRLELYLDLIKNYNAPLCECNEEYWMTIEELIKNNEIHFIKNGEVAHRTVEHNVNNLLKPACDKYNLNIYKLVKENKNKTI
ncbi:DUF5662 family protein [Clostridium botulinum]